MSQENEPRKYLTIEAVKKIFEKHIRAYEDMGFNINDLKFNCSNTPRTRSRHLTNFEINERDRLIILHYRYFDSDLKCESIASMALPLDGIWQLVWWVKEKKTS